jgi:fructose-bisphosphate aldolase class II
VPFQGGTKLREAYRRAGAGGYAFMANNVAEPNVLIGLLEAYCEARSDLLLQISPGAARFVGGGDKRVGLRALSAMVRELASGSPIAVFLNLDHFTVGEMAVIEEAIEARLVSSIMIDASGEAFDENVRVTRRVVRAARRSGILVEAELGKIKGVEDEIASDQAFYTDPDEAVEFVRSTEADLLAISIGTQHGVSKGRDIELRIDLATRIHTQLVDSGLDVPLVLHGSSGLLPDQTKEVIRHGILKLNKDTHYQYVYSRAACEFYGEHSDGIIPPEGIEDDVVNLFSDSDWSPNKEVFDPRVVGRVIQERVKAIALQLIEQAGSAARTLEG